MHAVKFACGSLDKVEFPLSTPEVSALLPVAVPEVSAPEASTLPPEASAPASVLAPESPAFPLELFQELTSPFPVSSPFPLGILSLISLCTTILAKLRLFPSEST